MADDIQFAVRLLCYLVIALSLIGSLYITALFVDAWYDRWRQLRRRRTRPWTRGNR